MKQLGFTRIMKPLDEPCYSDTVTVWDKPGGIAISKEFHARTWPNPFRPNDHESYLKAYGAIVPGAYPGKCDAHHILYHKCILINGGGEIPCLWPNTNHGGRAVLTETFVHRGSADNWSGSKGCLTIAPSDADEFFALFADGEEVQIEIKTLG